ncbi:MAG: CMP/dCMP kinase [Actinomycetota bacterium]|jgi:cytidylate kinase|nr:CMP/dCMP kinase [Actinomycetota bacterium]
MTAVAIDGPAGAGKSTVARAVASRLGYSYLDTGALYRAVALAAIERGIDPEDGRALADVTTELDVALSEGIVTLDGKDVTERVRDPDVTQIVSTVSAHPLVRRALLERQRALAATGDVVMEGRDIGSTVLPDADVKIYLTASPDERALRRAEQEGLATDEASLAVLKESIAERDEADATRDVSPLIRASGAELLDTSDLSIDEVVDRIVEAVQRAEAGSASESQGVER